VRRVRGIDRENVLVNMIPMHVVQMTIMKIVNVTFMDDHSVATDGSVLMGMLGMVLLVTSGHRFLFLVVGDEAED
jgi:uncharacterized membrane protein